MPKLFKKIFSSSFFSKNFFDFFFQKIFFTKIFSYKFFFGENFYYRIFFGENFYYRIFFGENFYFQKNISAKIVFTIFSRISFVFDVCEIMYFAKFFILNFAYCDFFCFAILVHGVFLFCNLELDQF